MTEFLAPPEEATLISTSTIPHNREAEEATVGAVLINPEIFSDLTQFLKPEDFYIVRHRWIWQALMTIQEKKFPIDLMTVSQELENCGQLIEVGGPAYLTALLNQVPTSLHAEAYARQVKENAIRRTSLALANELATAIFNPKKPIDTSLMDIRTAVDQLMYQASTHVVHKLSPVLAGVCKEVEECAANPCDIWGIPIGLPKLDYETGGLQKGELTIMAGEPGVGKTWASIGFALEMAKHSPGAFFSLEMSKEAITRRILAATSGVRAKVLRTGRLDENDWTRIYKAVGELETIPFYLDDRTVDLGGVRASLGRLKREAEIEWFVLDYMLMLENTGQDEIESTANASRSLKHICRDLDLAGLVIHSVNKAGMDKTGKEASAKSYLRGSGQVFYDADVVLYLTEFEPDSKLEFYSDEQKKRLATLWVKKGRELEDPRIRVHLTRKEHSPLWGEMEESQHARKI